MFSFHEGGDVSFSRAIESCLRTKKERACKDRSWQNLKANFRGHGTVLAIRVEDKFWMDRSLGGAGLMSVSCKARIK